jgi:hypothetical protein
MASQDDATNPKAAENEAAAIRLPILPSPSMSKARYGSSPRTCSKGFENASSPFDPNFSHLLLNNKKAPIEGLLVVIDECFAVVLADT